MRRTRRKLPRAFAGAAAQPAPTGPLGQLIPQAQPSGDCGNASAISEIVRQAQACTSNTVCDCDALGGNTFVVDAGSGAGLGIAPGGTYNLLIDAGDACVFRPSRMLLVAYRAGNTANRLNNPAERLPIILLGAAVGTIPFIRRTGQLNFGLISDGYSDNKEHTCVNWGAFTSTQNQGLSLRLFNPNDVAIHGFVDLWGQVLSA